MRRTFLQLRPLPTRFLPGPTLRAVLSVLVAGVSGAALGAGAALPAAAQDYLVARESFPFLGTELEIEVITDGPGTIQVVRGDAGLVTVAAHTEEGVTAVGLGGLDGNRLRLNALGTTEVSFIVIVPDRVQVSLLVPDQSYPTRVAQAPVARARWKTTPSNQPALRFGPDADAVAVQVPPEWAPLVFPLDAEGLYLVYSTGAAASRVSLEDAAVTRVQVRVEGERFTVRSSEPLHLTPAGPAAPIRVRTGDKPITLILTVPAATRFFQLTANDDVLLTIHEGRAATTCQRTASVRTADGGWRFEFLPLAGRLRCDPA